MKNNQSSIINSQLRVVFFGTPDFISPILDVLKKNFDVIAEIHSQKEFNSIINSQSSIVNNADLFVVAAYGQILPHELLSVPRLSAINIHPSLLPKYRGPSPIQTAILNGDKKTGVTFIKMDEEIDHGPIIEQFEEEILDSDTFESLAERLFEKSASKLNLVIENFSKNQTGKTQDDSKATFTKILSREDGYIDPSFVNSQSSMVNIKRMIRAYFPWPGVWTKYKLSNKEVVVKLLPNQQIQVEGKIPMSYKDFINGYAKGKKFLQRLNLN